EVGFMAMKTATITVDADFAQVWNAAPVAKRKRLQAEIRSKLLNGATVKKEVAHFSKRESELLLRVSRNLSDEERERMLDLTDRLEFESITDEESDELLRLTDKAEMLQAERLQAVVDLAKLRGVSFEEVMKQLGVKPRRYVSQANS
ncbi:MAG: hypothetical protein ACRD82_05620, partial [Blastocatellia bacterium]